MISDVKNYAGHENQIPGDRYMTGDKLCVQHMAGVGENKKMWDVQNSI